LATKTPRHKAAQRNTSCGFVSLGLSGALLRNTLPDGSLVDISKENEKEKKDDK
jgi:hypothetical protein